MKQYLKKYILSLLTIAAILYLSLFKPPQTKLDDISNIDKLVHTCMYGGLCLIIWYEYLKSHNKINWRRIWIGAVIAPIIMSGIIELIQAYCTTNRSGEWLDFAANSLGALLAFVVGNWGLRRFFKKTA